MTVRNGYKMTELGEIPEEWEIKKLSEVTLKIADRDHTTPIYVDQGIPIISPKDFNSLEIIEFNDCKFITEEAHQINRKKTDIQVGDIIFTRIGAGLGKACIVTSVMPEFSILHSAVMIRPNEIIIIGSLMIYLLKSSVIQKQISLGIQSIGVPDLGIEKINNLKVTIPNLVEQQQIAEILSTNDALITKTDELIEKTKEIKQGLMQELLTKGIGHTEFKDSELGRIPKEWEVKSIAEISIKITDGEHQSPKVFNSGLPLVSAKDIKERDVDFSDVKYVAEDDFKKYITKCNPQSNDILVVSRGATIGRAICIRTSRVFCLMGSVILIKLDLKALDGIFLNNYLLMKSTQVKLLNSSGSSAQQAIYLKDIAKVQIPVPTLSEQKRMGEILSFVDDKLETLKNRKQQLQEIKQGLMQDLLTGRVRVV